MAFRDVMLEYEFPDPPASVRWRTQEPSSSRPGLPCRAIRGKPGPNSNPGLRELADGVHRTRGVQGCDEIDFEHIGRALVIEKQVG